MVRSLAGLFAVVLTASGGSGFSSHSGREFPVRSALYLRGGNGLAVVLTDQPGGCHLLTEHGQDARALGLTLEGPGRSPDRGDYALQTERELADGRVPAARYFRADRYDGAGTELQTGVAGRVHLERNDSTSGGPVAGTFDVDFGGERVQGRFVATLCE